MDYGLLNYATQWWIGHFVYFHNISDSVSKHQHYFCILDHVESVTKHLFLVQSTLHHELRLFRVWACVNYRHFWLASIQWQRATMPQHSLAQRNNRPCHSIQCQMMHLYIALCNDMMLERRILSFKPKYPVVGVNWQLSQQSHLSKFHFSLDRSIP